MYASLNISLKSSSFDLVSIVFYIGVSVRWVGVVAKNVRMKKNMQIVPPHPATIAATAQLHMHHGIQIKRGRG